MSALCHIDDSEVSQVLGFPLITKAEPYTADRNAVPVVQSASPHTGWLVAAVIISTALAIVILLALLLLMHRYKAEENRHKRLLGSPGPGSSQEGASQASGSVSSNVVCVTR